MRVNLPTCVNVSLLLRKWLVIDNGSKGRFSVLVLLSLLKNEAKILHVSHMNLLS